MTLILQNDSFTRWEGLVDLPSTSTLLNLTGTISNTFKLLKVQFRVVVAWFVDVGKSGMNRHILGYTIHTMKTQS